MTDVLTLQNVTKTYRPQGRREVVALDDLSLTVRAGSFNVVTGASGSGKTTLLLAAGGLLQPEKGSVRVNGEDIYALSSENRARFRASRIGFVFQQFHLISFLSVLGNIMVPTLALSVDGSKDKARSLVDFLGLSHRMDHPPSELSTGERQRVALARALFNDPLLVLADEPVGNLDKENASIVLNHLRDFSQRGGAVLMATHDTETEADEKYVLKDGVLANHLQKQ